MKAKIKSTGREFEVESITVFVNRMDGEVGREFLMPYEVEILPTVTELSTKPDWEQRRYEIARDLYVSNENAIAKNVVLWADKLIAELQKPRI